MREAPEFDVDGCEQLRNVGLLSDVGPNRNGAAAGRLAASLALGRGLPADIAELGVSETALSPRRLTLQ